MTTKRNNAVKWSSRDRKITAFCFPKICSPLTTTLDVARYPHLYGLEFFDLNILKQPPADSNIDILLDADYCFDILSGEVVRGEDGPVAINSEFGWEVRGPTTNSYADEDVSRVNLLIKKQGYSPAPGSIFESNNETELVKSLRQLWERNPWEFKKNENRMAFSNQIYSLTRANVDTK